MEQDATRPGQRGAGPGARHGVHESLVYLYRVFCRPSAVAAETRAWRPWDRLRFMVTMSLVAFAANVLAGGLATQFVQLLGVNVGWLPGGLGRAAEGLAVGAAIGTAWSVLPGLAFAVIWGPVSWVLGGVVLPLTPLLPDAMEPVLAQMVAIGLASGVGLGLAVRTLRGAFWAVPLAICLGVLWPATWGWSAPARAAGIALVVGTYWFGYFRLEWYAIDAGGMLWELAVARRHPAQARALFRASPIYWREPIWLPLLGLKTFLHQVSEQDPQAGLEECLFVLLERPTQARLARAALVEITARGLAARDTVAEIASVTEAVQWGMAQTRRLGAERAPLPAVLAQAIPALEELARHAEQHMTATLPHNRRRALERLRDGADDLARRLAVDRRGAMRPFIAVARKWREVAEARLEALGEAEAAAGVIHNPYVFGQPIEETDSNLFVGRRDVVRDIEVSLLGGTAKPTLVLWGPRRMGKTSVLLQLPRLLGNEFAPAFVDMQGMGARESTVAFFRTVTEAAAGALQRRGIDAAALTRADLEGGPFSAFADWIEAVEERLGDKRYLLLCLDEFERLEPSIREGRLPPELMDQIRHIIQHHPRIVLLFAGSHRPDEMQLNWPDVLISTRLIRVSYLHEDEARQLITRPVPDFPVQYAPGSVERILQVTRGQPYLVQAVCYELVNTLNADHRKQAREADIGESVARALESTHLYFAEMWRQLSDLQRKLLHTISQSRDGAASTDLAPANGSLEEVEPALRGLESRGIVERIWDGEGWRVQVPMVAEWVRTSAQ